MWYDVLLWLVLAVFAVMVWRLIRVASSVSRYRSYWRKKNVEKPKGGDFKLLALGDSVAQGVGASHIQRSLICLCADYIAKQTGQNVYVQNVSVSGATVGDVLNKQLPQVDPGQFDMVMIVASANDALKNTAVEEYKIGLNKLLQRLPLERLVMSDMPYVRRRNNYIPTLHQLAAKYGVELVKYDIVLSKSRWPFVYVAGDFLHPNDRGYKDLWFESFRPHIDARLQQLKTEAK